MKKEVEYIVLEGPHADFDSYLDEEVAKFYLLSMDVDDEVVDEVSFSLMSVAFNEGERLAEKLDVEFVVN